MDYWMLDYRLDRWLDGSTKFWMDGRMVGLMDCGIYGGINRGINR